MRTRSVPQWRAELPLTPLDVQALLEYAELPLQPVPVNDGLQVHVSVDGLPGDGAAVRPVIASWKGVRWLTLVSGEEGSPPVPFPTAYTRRALELLDEGYALSRHPLTDTTVVLTVPLTGGH